MKTKPIKEIFGESFSSSEQVNNWYNKVPEEPSEFPPCPANTVQQLYDEAKKLLDAETKSYESKSNKDSEKRWMRSVMTRGTARDKVASYTLMVQESPMYNLQALESLIALMKPSKSESVSCVGVLVELFVSNLLKPNCKLKQFANHPLALLDELCSGNPATRRRRLVAWFFEDKLKSLYRDFIEALQRLVKDAADSAKEKAIGAIGKLLRSNSEQEAVLLSYLVNKLGDPNKQVASKAMHSLTQTLHQHPNMKGVMMDEVEKLLFRPNIGQKAQYYGICFLSQIMFSRNDSPQAAKLIKIYFSFFRACVKQGNIDSRLLKVLLSGVNRAYPYARESMDSISEQLETLYKVVHLAPFHIALHALNLIYQVADYKNSVSDRFYSVLYRTLLNPSLPQSPHFAIFLNLFYRALKKDESAPRVRAFIKRVLQVCCFMPAPLMCATLFTLSHLMRSRKSVGSLSASTSIKKEKAPVGKVPLTKFSEADSDDEHYVDLRLDENGDISQRNDSEVQIETIPTPWNHKKNLKCKPTVHSNSPTDYDPTQRNPLFAHGELCCYSELCLLATHYHPTVALFASQIMKGESVSYSGDPLKDFTLSRFLERFTFKNPKKQPQSHQNSVFAKRQNYIIGGLKGYPLSSKAYINQREEKIPVDERFLFRFLLQCRERSGKAEHDDDNESVGSEEFNDMLDDLMVKRGLKADVDEDMEDGVNVDFDHEYSASANSKKKKKQKDAEDDGDVSFSDDSAGNDDFDDDVEGGSLTDDNSDFKEYEDTDEQKGMDEHPKSKIREKQADIRKAKKGEWDGESDLEGIEDDIEGLSDIRKAKKGEWDGESDLEGIEDDIEGLSDYDDMEAIEFGDESGDEDENFIKKKGKRDDDDWESRVFVPTEEFAELLEAASNANQGSSSDVSNKDKAGAKQLAWEMNRDRWVKENNKPGNTRKWTSHHKKGSKLVKSSKKPFGLKKNLLKKRRK